MPKTITLNEEQARLARSALESLAEGLPTQDDVPDVDREAAGHDLQATSDLIEHLTSGIGDGSERGAA